MTVGQGVVRIDLERQFVDHIQDQSLQLEDNVDPEKMILEGVEAPASSETALLIDSEIDNYSVLRDIDRATPNSARRATALAQQNIENSNSVHTHTAQLISEQAEEAADNKDNIQMQVPLDSKNDAVYVGTLYIGSPVSQPATVVFDTGSEYLAFSSVLCDDSKAGNFSFKKYDPIQGGFTQRDQPHKRCKTMAYDMHKSQSQKILSRASSKVTYGSAKLQGFIWQDYTCIQPLK